MRQVTEVRPNIALTLVCSVGTRYCSAQILPASLTKFFASTTWGSTTAYKEKAAQSLEEQPSPNFLKTTMDAVAFTRARDMVQKGPSRSFQINPMHNRRDLLRHPDVFPSKFCKTLAGVLAGAATADNVRVCIDVDEFLESFEPSQRENVRDKILEPLSRCHNVELNQISVVDDR
mmetsp:Transcript_8782/g.26384  ORF Transcript_8782/g.26384 Transcript_8782/m.26384 type:complete len:175 (-) Transcript_8782:203-727(-)|eukprot:CAMPEP_0198734990 /NCGR_PEP_ID=MMETSP1475-20131203/56484_1 /TAXON_ID= ORGANISM="Unidentified sp., Strain CCMP1999" /NCGR_SAMPLE_ID=MMETSP1475 /ASSEMBLY_ACC=CAM_ASM_001111 /LENGTH=174 /DNA_ID=CAMNT_0044498573 /DNA_START=93 /DNA_END=617 /DNA_ORIENTATION=+